MADLLDFDHHLSLTEEKPIHFRNNILEERAYIHKKGCERRKMAVSVVEESDDEVEIVEQSTLTSCTPSPAIKLREGAESTTTPFQTPAKRPSHDDTIDSRPSQRQRCTPFSSSPSLSPMPSLFSPTPAMQHTEIIVPKSSKPWPHGMFTVDMMNAFRAVDTVVSKDRKLSDRLHKVFGKDIPIRTFQDQRKFWRQATERRRQAFVAAARSEAGLWSAFRDSSK